MPKFRSAHQSAVTVFIPEKPNGIRIHKAPYQTTDEDEVRALRANDDVVEVRDGKKGSSKK